jgi:hypothetical protein
MPLLALLNIEFIMHIYINLASLKWRLKYIVQPLFYWILIQM